MLKTVHAGQQQEDQASMRHAKAHLMARAGVQVFTTCGAQKKRDYLQQTFPFLDDAHIGDSRSTSFEDLIKEQASSHPCCDMPALTVHCTLLCVSGGRWLARNPWRCAHVRHPSRASVPCVRHGTAWLTEGGNADERPGRRSGAELAGGRQAAGDGALHRAARAPAGDRQVRHPEANRAQHAAAALQHQLPGRRPGQPLPQPQAGRGKKRSTPVSVWAA